MQNIIKILPAFLLLVSVACAQKLPKVQTSSVWAPADIKIDGKTTEWNDHFQAHNQPNHMYYTLSNDDDNLYLTVRMDDKQGDAKIFKGGLTFTIIPLDKKATRISVTFPVISKEKGDKMQDGGDIRLIDSLTSSSNNGLTNTYKEIYVTGITEISDPIQSIYNAQGIRVGGSLEKNRRYTYELAIPLKYLESAINNVKSIRYNIRLNAETIAIKNRAPYSGPVLVFGPPVAPESIDDLFNSEDSDFSGVYILALKP